MKDFMDDINSPASPPEPVTPQEQQGSSDSSENRYGYSGQNGFGSNYGTKISSTVEENTYDLPSSSGGERSIMTDILKAVLGALVGAIPGMALWVIIGKTGYIASVCGLLLAAGIVFGYTFMTKDDGIPLSWGVVICLVIMVSAVYFAERIVWTWEMVDAFKALKPVTRDLFSLSSDLYGYSDELIESFDIDKAVDSYMKSEFGFSEGTFGNCWSNFNKVIEATGSKSEFHSDLFMSYAFSALGGGSLFYKFARKR